MQTTKLISEVFSDYKTENIIKQAKILELNLIKKANVLEIDLESENYLEIKELWYFEKFLKERFQFSNKIPRQCNNKANRKRMGKLNMLYGTQIPSNETNDTTKKYNRSNKQ